MKSEYAEYLKEKHFCEICGSPASENHHISSRGANGRAIDKEFNLVSVCRYCHIAIHAYGNKSAMTKMPKYGEILKIKGWHIDNGKLFNDKLISD